jgi:hypothetical protein
MSHSFSQVVRQLHLQLPAGATGNPSILITVGSLEHKQGNLATLISLTPYHLQRKGGDVAGSVESSAFAQVVFIQNNYYMVS